jgi:hypothetical protein
MVLTRRQKIGAGVAAGTLALIFANNWNILWFYKKRYS